MRRALLVAAVLAAASTARADLPVGLGGGPLEESQAGAFIGLHSLGVNAWRGDGELRDAISLSWVYRWTGVQLAAGRSIELIGSKRLGLDARLFGEASLLTRGGLAAGAGIGGGLAARAGSDRGGFTASLALDAGVSGFYVPWSNEAAARVPLSLGLLLEGRAGHLAPFGAARVYVDTWPGKPFAVRGELLAGVAVRL